MRLRSIIRTAFIFLVAPFAVLFAVILAVDLFSIGFQLSSGNYADTLGQDIGFYLVFMPALLFALGIQKLRRML